MNPKITLNRVTRAINKDDGTGFYVVPRGPRDPRKYVPPGEATSRGTQRKVFRIEPDLWREYGEVCDALDVDRSQDFRAHALRRVRDWKRAQSRAATEPAAAEPPAA